MPRQWRHRLVSVGRPERARRPRRDRRPSVRSAQRVGFRHSRNVLRGSSGRLLGDIAVGEPLADGTPSLTMKRTRLARSLAEEATRRGIVIEGGRRFVEAARAGDRVFATFEDGSTIATDVLIGTDGIHSRVRTLIDPTAPAGRYVGLTSFGGVTPAGRVSGQDLERNMAVHLQGAGLLRGPAGTERRHRVVRQRARDPVGRRAGEHVRQGLAAMARRPVRARWIGLPRR